MGTNSNIQEFDSIVLQVFAKLYSTFPIPTDISIEDFELNLDTNNIDSSQEYFFYNTILWLEQSGFIIYTEKYEDFSLFREVILTPQSLNTLKSVPHSIDSKQTLGEKISECVSKGITQVATGQVADCINLVIGGAISIGKALCS